MALIGGSIIYQVLFSVVKANSRQKYVTGHPGTERERERERHTV